MSRAASRFLPLVVLLALVAGIRYLVGALHQEFLLTPLTMSGYSALAALGLCLFMGYAGQVSLGHAAFVAIGGYTSAVMCTVIHLAPWIGLVAGLAAAGIAAVIVGLPSLRLRGHYLAMATLSFGIIVSRIVVATGVFGQADGIYNVPPLRLVAGLAVSGKKALRVQNYWTAWGLVAVGLLLARNLAASRTGRALMAIHGDEDAASALGVNVGRHKLAAFVASALFGALAGSLLTHYSGGIGPSDVSIMKSIRWVALVAAGGMGSAGGVLAVTTVLTFLSLRGVFGFYDDAVFAAILLAIMLFAPQGIFRAALSLIRRKRGAAA